MSTTLVRIDEGGRQRTVYFVSKMLTDAGTRYNDFERITLVLRLDVKKLRLYFQAHIIVILSSYLIRVILHKPNASGRLLKWAIELSEFNILYHPRSAIKGQVLADFIAKMSEM